MVRILAVRLFLPLFALLTMLTAGCVYDSDQLNALKCSQEDQRKEDAVCKNGFWIYDPTDPAEKLDAGNEDASSESDTLEPPLDTQDFDDTDISNDISDVTEIEDTEIEDTEPQDVDDTDTNIEDDTGELDTDDFDINEPDIEEPDVDEPDVDEPDVDEPDVDEPDATEPDAGAPIGAGCQYSEQCASGLCENSICVEPLCENGILDPGEVDVDCGGTCANLCQGYVQVAAGSIHTCAIKSNNRVICWGTTSAAQVPAELTDVEFSSIAAGQEHTCAIRSDNQKVECWGKENDGRLNPGKDTTYLSINLGDEHGCGVKTNLTIHCWGKNNDNRIAGPPEGNRTNWKYVTAGKEHACSYKDNGSFVCWGKSDHSQFAFEATDQFKAMAAANRNTCAIRQADDTVKCVGHTEGALPESAADIPFQSLDARDSYACAIKNDASVFCWGKENNKRISDHPQTGQFTQVSTGWEHACAITRDDGFIQCWGNNKNSRFPLAFQIP